MTMTRRRLLDDTFKKTIEGNPAIAQGSLARMYPKIEMQGWTEQAQYEGNQLFDGVFTVDTVLDTNGETVPYSGRSTTDFIKVKQSTDYTGFTRYLRACYYDAGKVFISYDDDTVTRQTPEGCEYVRFCFINGSNVMFNEGSTALPYEPYTGGAPSPSPEYPQPITSAGKYNEETQKYEVEVKLTGKNLIDKEDLYSYEKLIKDFQGQGFWIYPIDIPDGTYTFSAENSPYTSGGYLAIGTYTQDSISARAYIAHPSVATKKATVELSGNKCIFLSARNQVNDNVKNAIGWIQLEHGSIATEYEPYKEPKTVKLTSDRPLTKWDKLEKRNGQCGWAYKSEEIESYTDESVPGEYYSTTGQLSTGAQVWYETATVTFVPLTAAEQEAMNALHTFRPTTVLSNDAGCEMSLTYKTKKKSLEVTT